MGEELVVEVVAVVAEQLELGLDNVPWVLIGPCCASLLCKDSIAIHHST
jgi:hypothetical protein